MATKPEVKTLEMKMYLHRKQDGTETLRFWDSTLDYRGQPDQDGLNRYGACMGAVQVTAHYPDIEGDPTAKVLEALEQAVEKERADSQVRVNLLMERISQLKCITHESAS